MAREESTEKQRAVNDAGVIAVPVKLYEPLVWSALPDDRPSSFASKLAAPPRIIPMLPRLLSSIGTAFALLILTQPRLARADDFDDIQERAIKDAVTKVAPVVVQIETSGGNDIISAGPRGAVIRKGFGPTSGVIVASDGFVISSAFNFANKPSAIFVSVPGHKERYVAEAVATDHSRMLTLLKLKGVSGELPVAVPVPKAEIKIGQTAVTLGRTLSANADQPPSVSVGIISALGRIWGKALQTDAKVSPTNYGGPLIDLTGRVQGILVPASPQSEGETAGVEWYDSGIGFAIPLEDVLAVLARLKQGKDLKRGFLGISFQGDDMYSVAPTIATVAPGSAAEKAGFKPGDTIIEVAGKPVTSHAQVMHQIGTRYEGDTVSVKLRRDGKEISPPPITLTGVVAAFGQPFLGILPIRDDPEPGVEVRYVYPRSPADTAGIKEGDRLLKIGQALPPGQPSVLQPLAGRDMLAGLLGNLAPGIEIRLEVKRKAGGKTDTLTVKLADLPDGVPEALPERASAGKALAPSKATGPMPPKEEKKDEEEKKEEKKDKDGKKLEKGLLKRTTPAADHGYWVYVPENYDPNVAHALVIWLHPVGKNKDRDIDDLIWVWQPACEDEHIILVGPKTDNERGWNGGDAEFVQEVAKAVADSYSVDRRRIVAHGMGLGGEMAFYLGFNARALIRGVAVTGAGLTSNPKEKVAAQSLAFFLAVGGKDPLKGTVEESKKKLAEFKYPVILREVTEMGHQYLDGRAALPTFDEMVRWIDSLDRI
jgi:serine protease Do